MQCLIVTLIVRVRLNNVRLHCGGTVSVPPQFFPSEIRNPFYELVKKTFWLRKVAASKRSSKSQEVFLSLEIRDFEMNSK